VCFRSTWLLGGWLLWLSDEHSVVTPGLAELLDNLVGARVFVLFNLTAMIQHGGSETY
jgi:hypothetical protein